MHTPQSYSEISPTFKLAQALSSGLLQELELTPKPGLVDQNNNGSHADLDFDTMSRSVNLLDEYFHDCAVALEDGGDVFTLRELGKIYEQKMMDRFETNTHRGAIFLGGLLMAAFYSGKQNVEVNIESLVAQEARRLFEVSTPSDTTGAVVRQRFNAGGIIEEALKGLPSVFSLAVPTLQLAKVCGMNDDQARFLAMSRLMQTVEDTTSLKRCGRGGLALVRVDGKQLESMVNSGLSPEFFLLERDRDYRELGLTMGGIADLLGLSIAWNEFATPFLRPAKIPTPAY